MAFRKTIASFSKLILKTKIETSLKNGIGKKLNFSGILSNFLNRINNVLKHGLRHLGVGKVANWDFGD